MIAFVVAAVALAAAGLFLVSQQSERAEAAEVAHAVTLAQLETLRQVTALTAAPNDKVGYDKQQAVRKHQEAIDAIRKKYPTHLKPDAFIEDMEAKASAGQKDKAKTAEYRTRYDYAKQVFNDHLKNGGSRPVLTAESHGVRIDVMSIRPSNEGGEEGLRWDIIIWGAPPKDQLQLANLELGSVIHFAELETSGKRKGQPKRTVVRQEGPAMPYVLLDKPWEWMPEWPVGVMAGYYINMPKFDSRTDRAFISIVGQIRTVGGTTIPLEMKWNNVAVESSWKGMAGGKFDTPDLQALSDDDLQEQGVDFGRFESVAEDTGKNPRKK